MGEIILRLAQQPSGHVRAHAEQAPSGFVRVSSILQAAVPEALRSLWHRLRCSWRYAAALRDAQRTLPSTAPATPAVFPQYRTAPGNIASTASSVTQPRVTL